MKNLKCRKCGKEISDSEAYEYRGAIACEECFDSVVEARDFERQEVMEITEAVVKSQRTGEFVNNRKKYHLGNVAPDGLPIVKIREPQALRDYEKGGAPISREGKNKYKIYKVEIPTPKADKGENKKEG